MPDIPRIVLMMNAGAGYDRGIFRGIARYARHYGPWSFWLFWEQFGLQAAMAEDMECPPPDPKSGKRKPEKSALVQLRQLGANGVVGRLVTPEIVEAVLALDIPAVALDLSDEQLADRRLVRRISHLCPDSHKAGRMAAAHLIERGFRRFGFCADPKNPNWSRERSEGFREQLTEAGYTCEVYHTPPMRSPISWYREQPSLVAWLQSLQKPVGIMACNDNRGRQVIEACALGKMHVPNDVAVLGVDEDQVLSELSNPPLSSIALNGERGGYQAAELLHRMLSGQIKKPQRILVEPLWVVARLSTDVIAVEDRDVADTVRYIRENARRPLQIMEVVKHSGISRRALEIRFHRSLGWSIREEIERVRIDFAKQLLAETDLPTWKIADNTGFSGEDYLGKVFRRVTGATLAKYRREHRAT
jgi:LacI family transcriptional regulator